MPVVVEGECLASVPMVNGLVMSMLKTGVETVTTSLLASRDRMERGKFYRVTIEEIPCLSENRDAAI